MPTSPHPAPILVGVVEDDSLFREAFTRCIAEAGTLQLGPVAATRSGGIAMLQGLACDVLLVDLGLPDGSGIDVVRAAHAAWPTCQAMVVSAFADEAHVLSAVEAGARGYLLKDSTPQAMVSEIQALHAGGSPISPVIARRLLERMHAAPSMKAPEADAAFALSDRELQVLQLVSKGFAYEEIAQRMAISPHTVRTFVRRTYAKLEVSSKMEAVNAARRKGILPQ